MTNLISSEQHEILGTIAGPLVIIGMGSIGKGLLPLIERHLRFDQSEVVVICPDDSLKYFLGDRNYKHINQAITPSNYKAILRDCFPNSNGFCVNVSVDTSSLDLIRFCHEINVHYIDTVVEPWPGFYFGEQANEKRTNYYLRESMRDFKASASGGVTCVSCCGANPGMVSWLVKEALLCLAVDLGHKVTKPESREEWARLMQKLGVKGVHIAERDTQVSAKPRPKGVFYNTWSVEGFVSEGFQPAELGWGTSESWMPDDAHIHQTGCKAAIWLNRPGASTRVRSWCPTHGAQFGYLITHNEAISIADYFTVGDPAEPEFRPTCHYAYHPCDDAVLSLHETFGSGKIQEKSHVLDADEILEGCDELGVLLYGHENNALWYGSRLSNKEARTLAPDQNATGLQVSSAILSGIIWILENPSAGIVESDEMDHVRCLEVQRPYLGPVEAHYTDWTPLHAMVEQYPQECDRDNPWSFLNVLVR